MISLWENAKKGIRKELSEKSFSLWINPITVLDRKGGTLVLGCPNKFSLNWISENYKGIIEKIINNINEEDIKISLKIAPSRKNGPVPEIFKTSKQLELPNISVNRGIGRRRFKKEFTFDRFVVGECNEFAYSASKALALGSTWSYDSLFLLSNTGLGKSHLVQSIGNAILDQNKNIRLFYITAEDFVNEMIFALKNNLMEDFKNRYRRSCDVLLLEEVHFLSGKEKMQLEMGYTLDALINENKKIIFTSSMLPKDIPNITKGFTSRLTSGVITNIENPDYPTRVRIIEKKASEQNQKLSEDIVHLLAETLTKDVRQIESALHCLKAKSELLKARIDLDLAKEVIKCHITEDGSVSILSIKKIVCRYFKVDPAMLSSKSRKKIHSYPRNIHAYLCRHFTDATLEDIGRSIDRNHSTVLYASEVIEKKMKVDNRVKKEVAFLNNKIMEMSK
ncbi:MAG: chromosomal replication initiator protein DnaA [Deltaproteobacteria bacterium]|nr:chromosomal replication initiator protein DnaA [Deltaproteobacteria bacterium]